MLDFELTYEAIAEFLVNCAPGGSAALLPSDRPDQPPVLVFKSGRVWAGFTLSSQEVLLDYENAYSRFKADYLAQVEPDSTIDPVFVLVLSAATADAEGIASKIETDVYFCRKFVVSAHGSLELTFSRLPFLPLAGVNGADFRPPSAQTFMRSLGISAELARNLAVASTKGPEKILEECIGGRFGEPSRLSRTATLLEKEPSDQSATVKLKSIRIENFRAYRRAQEFTVGEDVTVLYGPNGFGKTSFFDAIDFAVTGGIGRFRSLGDDAFSRVAAHLDASPSDAQVTMDFERDGAIRTLSRRLSNSKAATIQSSDVDRKKVISELTGGASLSTERIENLVNLFRAMHLFSQDNEPALTEQGKSELSTAVVSRMLAFEDYANAVAKASRVVDLAKTRIKQSQSEVDRIAQLIIVSEAEIEALSGKATEARFESDGSTLSPELRTKLQRLGIDPHPVGLNPEVVRGWRATVVQRREVALVRKRELEALISDATSVSEANTALGRHRTELAHIANERTGALLQVTERKDAIKLLESARAEARASVKALQNRCRLLEVAAEASSELEKRRAEADALSLEEASASERLDSVEKALEEARGQLDLADAEIAATQAALALSVQRVRQLEALKSAFGEVELARAKLLDIQAERTATRNGQGRLEIEARQHAAELANLDNLIADKSREIELVESRQTELKNLVDQIRTHLHGSDCVLCGHSYQSHDELVSRIEGYQRDNSGADLQAILAALTDRREIASKCLDRANIETARLTLHLTNLDRSSAELDKVQATFLEAAATAGVAVNGDEGPLPSIESFLTASRSKCEIASRELEVRGLSQSDAMSQFGIAQLESIAVSITMRNLQTGRESVVDEVARLSELIRTSDVRPESTPQELNSLLAESRDKLRTSDLAVAALSRDIDTTAELLRVAIDQETRFKTHANEIEQSLAASAATISTNSIRLKQAGLPLDVETGTLSGELDRALVDEVFLAGLIEELVSVELSIDSATTAAALLSMRNAISVYSQAMEKLDGDIKLLKPWAGYFQDTVDLVSSQQAEAIESFTVQYGPRTSVIQQRLRSVYGFEDIHMQSVDSRIMITVKRNDQTLRPSDYFSQSQQQTLLLGLFITACTSQTWSAFAPIFLDDPVTHFDDLNTYAFLDLILGLTGEATLSRQFIISTCDEKFLHLARRKFRGLGSRARFYRFSAIGEEGPVVAEMA